MKHLRITFFNTKVETFGEYQLHRSTTEKSHFEVSYNTDNFKRALAFATRAKRKIQRENPLVGHNARIEFITK